MASKIWQRLAMLGGILVLSAALSGCLLQYMHGYGGVVVTSQLNVVTIFGTGTETGDCHLNGAIVACPGVVAGQNITPTAYLVGTDNAVLGFFDPLILEVPDNVISATGSYDTGSGPLALSIRQTGSFPVEPSHRISAELNTTFLILDMPHSVDGVLPAGGQPISYSLSFHQLYPLGSTPPPVTAKPLQAGEVTVLWQTYYLPLFPCIYDYQTNPFAAIPPITIPRASGPQDLFPTLADLIQHGAVSPCHFAVYNFTFATPPRGLLFLPLVRR